MIHSSAYEAALISTWSQEERTFPLCHESHYFTAHSHVHAYSLKTFYIYFELLVINEQCFPVMVGQLEYSPYLFNQSLSFCCVSLQKNIKIS